MNRPHTPTAVLAATLRTARRSWGRHQHQLAIGHASLGNPRAALRHARKAIIHLGRAGDQNRELGAALDTLATYHQELGQLDAAAQARHWCVDLLHAVAPGSIEWVTAIVKLGDLHRFQGHYRAAEETLLHALADTPTDQHTDGMPPRAGVLNALGIVYKDTGRYDQADRAYHDALDLVTASVGADHLCAAALWHNLAGLTYAQGHPARAEPLAARAVRIRERHLGPDHPLVGQDLAVLGATLLDQNRVNEAEALFERALAIFRRRHPADQYEAAVNLSNIAACRHACGDTTNAELLFRQGLALKQAILGPEHPEIARQLNNLGVAIAERRPTEADELRRQASWILDALALADDIPS